MKRILVAVRDIKADYYNSPILCDNVATAVRQFGDACRNADLPMIKHPEDYALYQLGDYDLVSGVITGRDQPLHLCSAEEVLRNA